MLQPDHAVVFVCPVSKWQVSLIWSCMGACILYNHLCNPLYFYLTSPSVIVLTMPVCSRPVQDVVWYIFCVLLQNFQYQCP